jgi:hypothetical protein
MGRARLISLLLLCTVGMFAPGCEVAHYQYTIQLDDAAYRGAHAEAEMTVCTRNCSRTRRIPIGKAATVDVDESLTFLIPIVPIPGGISVKVTQDGFQTWQQTYNYTEFVDEGNVTYRRSDLVLLEPMTSLQPSE